jgi:4-hydroxybenzoate polyprenyltransferase
MKRVTYWPQAVLGASASFSLPSSTSLLASLKTNRAHSRHALPPRKQILGLAFNWGALLGWSAVSGAVYWPVAGALYAGGVLWTLVYDSIYAHQDKTDDVRVGIHSTALLFGGHTRSILAAFSASSVGCIAFAGYLNAHGAPFFLGTALAAAQLARVVHRTDFDDRGSCGRGFVACGWAGFWIWMGALGDYAWLQLRADKEPGVKSVS